MAAERSTCLFMVHNCRFFLPIIVLLLLAQNIYGEESKIQISDEEELLPPTVFVAILIRNKAFALPWFFGHFENLLYPKRRMAIWIRSDHNIDNSTLIVKEWVAANKHEYNWVEFVNDDNAKGYLNEEGPCDWTEQRYKHVIQLREQALNKARFSWSSYLLMLDADVMLENPNTLNILVSQKQVLIAPMMTAAVGTSYSNFWAAMDGNGYYKRVPEYFEIVDRNKTGIFKVPMVHTIFLLDLQHKKSELLSYLPPSDNKAPEDDIILFAFSAAKAQLSMYILNTEFFGHVMVPLESYQSLFVEEEQFTYMRIEILDAANPDMGPGVDYIIDSRGLRASPHIHIPMKSTDRLGFDKVYMINLERRSERRKRMLHVLDVLGIDAELIPAVDGKLLNDLYLYKELKIEVVPGFADPYGGRPMTVGEIGCFLSHYFIWQDMVAKNYSEIVVFEDDLRFEPYFRTKLKHIMHKVQAKVPNWDLIYLGRKRLNRKDEHYLEGTDTLVWPSYSYWTLSYLLSSRGAKKLLAQKPLQHLLPVDEYLPVMFDKHPEASWKEPFHPRDLIALSAEPLLIYPTHYIGNENYISDTEYSKVITAEKNSHNSAEEPEGVAKTETQPDGVSQKHMYTTSATNRPDDEL